MKIKRLFISFLLVLSLAIPQVSFAYKNFYDNIDGKINDLQQVVSDSGELAAATTSITISNLDGDTDMEYELIVRGVRNEAVSANLLLYIQPNGDTTAGNYGIQSINGTNATASAYRDTTNYQGFATGLGFLYNVTGQVGFSHWIINAKSGYVRTAIGKEMTRTNGTTVNAIVLSGCSWNNTANNITSLVVASDTANGLGIGSRIILLRKVNATTGKKYYEDMNIKGLVKNAWQEVTRGTLTGAATSATISNLTGNTDVLYRLRTRTVNAYNGSSSILLRPNNDSTADIYGYQQLYGGNTTVGAARGTLTWIYAGYCTGLNAVSQADILLYVKSGYVRTGLVEVSDQSGTTVSYVMMFGQSWNNTADEITSLVIVHPQTNGLGVGTFYVLERLNLN